ncbi:hypothetical protein F5X97DRAFT_340602 [Nemania serpens]|nr:hypothetical protein F5X97DRAFT_340602 [Nemania serpens]
MSAASTTTFPPGYEEEDIGQHTLAVAVLFIVLDITIVALRFITRSVYKTRLGVDDALIIPALIFAVGICVIAIVEVRIAGVGRHLDVLYATNPQAVVNWAKCGYAIETIYSAAVAVPKLSIIASYLRIFTDRRLRIATWIVGGVIAANGLAGIITSLASCHPFSARWDPALFQTHCIDAPRFWEGTSVPNVVTDAVMLALPLPTVWRLHIDTKQKIALSAVFALGSFGLIASAVRLSVTFRVTTLEDGTWDSADIALWSLIEAGLYLIAACLPVLRPLYLSILRRIASIAPISMRTPTKGSQLDIGQHRGLKYVEMDSWQHDNPAAKTALKGGNSC